MVKGLSVIGLSENSSRLRLFPGWEGVACHIPDCPGEPDCNNRGTCDGTVDPPQCVCNDGWMFHDCNQPCLHGKEIPKGTYQIPPFFLKSIIFLLLF